MKISKGTLDEFLLLIFAYNIASRAMINKPLAQTRAMPGLSCIPIIEKRP
ncbi:MAG: hypothetical protein A4E47_00115 [Methanosaeta sp. PtaU1.Bin028]|nr:MAG: hypothetical protein A4E47_00115 [Methanosaeta sp. PtaU1.Bin028]